MTKNDDKRGAQRGASPPAEPSKPPDIRRRVRLTRKQWVGLPLLFAIPVLALGGVFGEQRAVAHATSRLIDARVAFPTRFRYRQIQSLHVLVRNVSGQRIDTLTVAFDTAYVSRFSSVRFDPPTRDAYNVVFTDLGAGETRLVAVELTGDHYWTHTGRVAVLAGHDTVATLRVATTVFP